MSRLRVYVDGRPSWQDLGPGYARVPWTARGSVNGSHAISESKPEGGHTPASYAKGVATRREMRGQEALLRGQALEP